MPIRSPVIVVVFSILTVGANSFGQLSTTEPLGPRAPAQASQIPGFSEEKAILGSIAIAGTPPADAVERYASYFDTVSYTRAMADEFEWNRSLIRMTSVLADRVGKVAPVSAAPIAGLP